MKKGGIIALAVIGILVLIGLGTCSFYTGTFNSIVSMDEQIKSQWAQVENQYQRRLDLIPNLVATAKGYAAHESTVFTEVSQARAQAGGVMHMDENLLSDEKAIARFQEAQNSLGGALQRLLSISENYPELKANEQFLALQNQLEGTENRIAVERKRFNESVQQYNKTIRMFPQNIVANMGGFTAKAYFSADEKASSAPAVSF